MDQNTLEPEVTTGEILPVRKPYSSPKLIVWGKLAEITDGTAGGTQDGIDTGTRTFF